MEVGTLGAAVVAAPILIECGVYTSESRLQTRVSCLNLEANQELVKGLPSSVRNNGSSGKARCRVLRYRDKERRGQKTELMLDIMIGIPLSDLTVLECLSIRVK